MIRAWHFVGDILRDGRPVPKDGQWLEHEGPIALCESGLHASRSPFDALRYAPGPVLCLVECDGVEDEESDKVVCRRRRIIARRDMTEYLRWFARSQGLSVVHLWEAPDVVLDWLMTGDKGLRRAAEAAAAYAAAAAAAYAAAEAAAAEAAAASAKTAAEVTAADPANARFFAASPKAGHAMFDLPGYIAARIERAGIVEFENLGLCTYAEPERFFSYRRTTHRNEPDYGRHINAIALAG